MLKRVIRLARRPSASLLIPSLRASALATRLTMAALLTPAVAFFRAPPSWRRSDSRVSRRASSASDRPMPASAPAVASNPAQKALPISALITGTIGRKKPIAMQATQVRMRKAALATTLTPPRVTATVRKLAYQRSAKATIVAAIRMNDLLNSQPAEASHCERDAWATGARAHEARLSCLASAAPLVRPAAMR